MYTKEYVKDGYKVVEHYQSWYDVLFQGWYLGITFLFVGVISLFVSPFLAFWSLYKPNCTGHHGVRERDFDQSPNRETQSSQSWDNLT